VVAQAWLRFSQYWFCQFFRKPCCKLVSKELSKLQRDILKAARSNGGTLTYKDAHALFVPGQRGEAYRPNMLDASKELKAKHARIRSPSYVGKRVGFDTREVPALKSGSSPSQFSLHPVLNPLPHTDVRDSPRRQSPNLFRSISRCASRCLASRKRANEVDDKADT